MVVKYLFIKTIELYNPHVIFPVQFGAKSNTSIPKEGKQDVTSPSTQIKI